VDLRATQKPLKERYREDPSTSRITLRASGAQTEVPVTCSVDIGRATYEAQAHGGVGGPGTGACSGDLLLGALAACAQLTCQMVATSMGIPFRSIAVSAEGDLDLRGTLGVDKSVGADFIVTGQSLVGMLDRAQNFSSDLIGCFALGFDFANPVVLRLQLLDLLLLLLDGFDEDRYDVGVGDGLVAFAIGGDLFGSPDERGRGDADPNADKSCARLLFDGACQCAGQ